MSALAQLASGIRRLIFRPVVVVELREGKAHVRGGDPPPGLVAEFVEVATNLGVASGTIYVVKAGHGLTLDFSSEIPARALQRFRNVLSVHRHRIKGA